MGIQQSTAIAPSRVHSQHVAWSISGPRAAALALALIAGAGALLAAAATAALPRAPALAGAVVLLVVVARTGFVVVQPNESRVLMVFGRYTGTLLEAGFHWVNPLSVLSRKRLSLRVRSFQGEPIKVNDASGNPIEVAAVVVWRVVDTAKAVFDVEDFEQYVVVQSETAVRHLASRYPYDDYNADTVSLRRNADEILGSLHRELQARLGAAGIEVVETRLTHLAYAAEIAEVMLRRQQAEAVLAARRTMVAGAVSLVEMALEQLEETDLIELDSERKAAMVSNLMVVLSGDHAPTPVLNTGTLYT